MLKPLSKTQKINISFGAVGLFLVFLTLLFLNEEFIVINIVLVNYMICLTLCLEDLKIKAYKKRYCLSFLRMIFTGQKIIEYFLKKKSRESRAMIGARIFFSILISFIFLIIHEIEGKYYYLLLSVFLCELLMGMARKINRVKNLN